MKQRLYTIIFESDTRSGKAFDIGIMIAILASVSVVMLDTVSVLHHVLEGYFTDLNGYLRLFFQ